MLKELVIIKNKNLKIQVLRGIAIIAVVMIHTCPDGLWQVFCRPFINFAVALFLFLSGYLTNIDNSNWNEFYKKRIIRVIIPYIIWTLLYTTIGFIGNGIELYKYAINLLSTKSAATLYYIFIYIEFTILTPFIGKLAKSKYSWLGFLISPIFVIIKYYWLFSNIVPNKFISALYDICCFGWFSFYYLGLLFGNNLIKKQFNINRLLLLYGLSIILQIFEGYAWFMLGETGCGTQLILSSILTSSIFILISYWYINNDNINLNNKLLIIIGDCSFGIYISHILVIKVLYKLPFFLQIPFGLNSIIVLFLTLFFVLIGQKICGNKISKYLGLS